MKYSSKRILIILLICITNIGLSQSQNFWSLGQKNNSARSESDIKTTASTELQLDFTAISVALKAKKLESLAIPLPDGSFTTVELTSSSIMSPELARKYPSIKTFRATDHKGISGNIDITSKGFHGFFFTPQGTVFIDPINKGTQSDYQVYYRKDYLQKEVSLLENDVYGGKGTKVETKEYKKANARSSGTQLRLYRLAITSTGEYTQFHGGSVADGLAAIVTTMNRVTGIYEREVAITFQLIEDTDLLIYTDPATDPYTNDDSGIYIDEVQDNIDNIIGNADYDIGHGFSTGAGGLAGPGPCQTGRKATGVTGISSPIGDPFDVDYVAHEIGHQFSANHTFNGDASSCSTNRNASTAFEPGSGSSILAYAGICGSQNIVNNSDPFFHTASYDEILDYSVNGAGNSCATITSTSNNPPTVDAGESGFTIPISTPFTLTGSGNDPDGDDLTFSWEQYNLGPAGDPNEPVGNAPLFRFFAPKDIPSRTFPDISDVINNTQSLGELLPSYSRSLRFRLTARDNQNGGGGVNYDEISFDVTDQAGPFVITSFNTDTTIFAQSNVNITWDVANTNNAEVDCQSVNILLSEDGGLTYPTLLASNVPNIGSTTILIPDVITSSGRIKIEAADNVFFDINDVNINIEAPVTPDFFLDISQQNLIVCSPENADFEINVGSILGFSDQVMLTVEGINGELSSNFSVNPVIPDNSSILTISETDMVAAGDFSFVLNATSGSDSKTQDLSLEIINLTTNIIEIISPQDNSTEVPLFTDITWTDLGGETIYEIDIATDDNFTSIIDSQVDISDTKYQSSQLMENTTYHIRIRGTNTCGTSDYSISSFTTSTTACLTIKATDTPITINGTGTPAIVSEIEVFNEGVISDVNIQDLNINHTFISDLTIVIESPAGTMVTLIDGICGNNNNLSLSLDDQAASGNIPCPPTDGGTYQPEGSLAEFNGESSVGIWKLRIQDNFNLDGGELTTWTLEICGTLSNIPRPPSNLTAVEENQQIALSWSDNSTNEEGFILEKSIGNDSTFEVLTDNLEMNSISFIDDFDQRNSFYYRLKAFNVDGESAYSNIAEIVLSPDSASNLTADLISLNQINLSWIDNSTNEEVFIVERSVLNNSNYVKLASLDSDSTTYEDLSLIDPNIYFYRLKAVNEGGESAYSNEVEVSSLILSTDNEFDHELSLYPNPSTGLFFLDLKEVSSTYEVNIYDVLGNKISGSLTRTGQKMEVDLSSKADGIYYLRLINNDTIQTFRLIKSKYK